VFEMKRARQASALAAMLLMVCSLSLGPAQLARADTAVERAFRERSIVVERVHALQQLLKTRAADLRETIRWTKLVVNHDESSGTRGRRPWKQMSRDASVQLDDAQARLAGLERWVSGRIRALKAIWHARDAWLDTYAVFRACPVPSFSLISDDFGAMRRLPGVPVHSHMGNDVLAASGTPIFAPFDGYATRSWNWMGGNVIHIDGDRGAVYGAHLVAYGKLGYVRAGDVVGYVGATGDATTPHLHIEWHPGGGGAVDPHSYLLLACVDA
jgi:murein DD-endopeptidase MepM/ murein hydrolase activator NlpD